MTEIPRFIDSAGTTVEGKDACVEAWRGFFDSFPEYSNVFDDITEVADGVVLGGRTECSFAPLDGPAEWRAAVVDARVEVWQESDPGAGDH